MIPAVFKNFMLVFTLALPSRVSAANPDGDFQIGTGYQVETQRDIQSLTYNFGSYSETIALRSNVATALNVNASFRLADALSLGADFVTGMSSLVREDTVKGSITGTRKLQSTLNLNSYGLGVRIHSGEMMDGGGFGNPDGRLGFPSLTLGYKFIRESNTLDLNSVAGAYGSLASPANQFSSADSNQGQLGLRVPLSGFLTLGLGYSNLLWRKYNSGPASNYVFETYRLSTKIFSPGNWKSE